MKVLNDAFFDQDAAQVAIKLLGKVLWHRYREVWLSTMIIETEAYYIWEKGSHASLGFTEKRKALFMKPGTIYMYYARGGDSLNVSCQGEGNAVLIKAGYVNESENPQMIPIMQKLNPLKNRLRPVDRLCSGQTILCKSLGIKVTEWDQKRFNPKCFFIEATEYKPQKVIQTPRLGIPPGRDENLLLRFVDYDYSSYSTQNPLTRKKMVNNGWVKSFNSVAL